MSNTSDQTTQQSKTRLIVGEIGVDTETGIIGKGHSYDNGKTFVVDDTIYGRIYHKEDHGRIWNGIQEKVERVVKPAISSANSAYAKAQAAIESAHVTEVAAAATSQAVTEAKQGANDAMSRAKSAWDVATNAKSAVTDFDPLLKQAQSDAKAAGSSAAVLRADMDKVTSLVNDPKTGLNATYQTAAGNATTISNVKSDVYQLETTATGLTSRVGNLESKSTTQQTEINQTKAAVALKAEQADVDTLKGNVTNLQAENTTQANEIKNKVTRSDVTGMLTGYATQEYAQGLVTLKADEWNLNLTNLKTDVNAIKTAGGGVNLLSGTKDFSGFTTNPSFWEQDTSVASPNGQTAVYKRTGAWSGLSQPIEVQSGKTYTFNAWVKVSNYTEGKDVLHFYWNQNTGTKVFDQNTDSKNVSNVSNDTWMHIIRTATAVETGTAIPRFESQTDTMTVWVTAYMLEEGTVAHTWSPAPSDMATVTSVTNLSATVDGIKGLVETKADKSEVTQLSNLVQTKVSSGDFTSTTTQLKNMINQRVQVGDVISQINQEAGGNTLIQVSNGKGSLILDAENTIITGKAFIPGAAISEINTDQLYFSDSNGNKSFMSATLGALDPEAPSGTLSTRYKTGYEITTSDRGVFFMMGPNYTRYAVRSKYSDKFSGIWADSGGSYMLAEGQGLHLWSTGSNQSCWGLYNSNNVGVRASQTNTNAIEMGKADDGFDYKTKMDTSPTAIQFSVNGWEWVAGYVEAMGHSLHSTLSSKTRIEEADPDHMLDLINDTELTTFAYKAEVADGTEFRHIGPIIDDVNDVAQYQTPDEFIAPTKTARDDGNIVGALIGAVQALTKRIKTLEEKIK